MSKSFNNTKNKIKTIWDLSQKNKNQVDNNLKKINIQLKDINFSKNIITIPLVENTLFDGFEYITFEYTFTNFPDWAIPMARIVPVFYFDDSYSIDDVVVSSDYHYSWTKIEDTHYVLTGYILIAAIFDSELIPVYLDMNVVIVNDKNYYNIQTEGI